jgi:hypothetical protein
MWRGRGVALLFFLLPSCTAPPIGEQGAPRDPAPKAERSTFTRTCESSVFGDLGHGWRRGQPAAGPAIFVAAAGYADDPRRWFEGRGELATQQKVLLVVVGRRPVTVSVRGDDALLAYDPARWGDRRLVPFRRGDRSVRFEPCPEVSSTQFNGGFLVRRPACVEVAVRPDGEDAHSTTLSFGAGSCGG